MSLSKPTYLRYLNAVALNPLINGQEGDYYYIPLHYNLHKHFFLVDLSWKYPSVNACERFFPKRGSTNIVKKNSPVGCVFSHMPVSIMSFFRSYVYNITFWIE